MDISLRFSIQTFTLAALDRISLPPYKGSAIRGGFGHAFRKVVCAIEELGRMGIGRGKGKYRLEAVSSGGETIYTAETRTLREQKRSLDIPSDPSPVNHLTLTFLTPARIKYEEQLAPDPEFHVLIRNLLRRISSLSYFHSSNRLELDFKGIIGRAADIKTVRRDITWIDWERYSSRQDTRMKFGGFIGEIELEGDLTEFMPYLRLGEIVHIGKATSFGLGKYVVTPPLSPSSNKRG